LLGLQGSGDKQYFLASMLDITARKEAEKEIMDAHERMLTILDIIDAFVTGLYNHSYRSVS